MDSIIAVFLVILGTGCLFVAVIPENNFDCQYQYDLDRTISGIIAYVGTIVFGCGVSHFISFF